MVSKIHLSSEHLVPPMRPVSVKTFNYSFLITINNLYNKGSFPVLKFFHVTKNVCGGYLHFVQNTGNFFCSLCSVS